MDVYKSDSEELKCVLCLAFCECFIHSLNRVLSYSVLLTEYSVLSLSTEIGRVNNFKLSFNNCN